MTAKSGRNGRNNRLEEAMALLIQNQAAFVQTQAAFVQNQTAFNQTIAQLNQNQTAIMGEVRELERQTADRFARIERILLEHTQILQEHSRILHDLPEAVRQRMGFKPAQQ